MSDKNKSLREAEDSGEDETSRGAERLFEAMSEIDDTWVEEAAGKELSKSMENPQRRRFPRRLAALAACFCVTFVAYAAWRVSTPEKSTAVRETDMDLYGQEEAAAETEETEETAEASDVTTAAEDIGDFSENTEETIAAAADEYDSLEDLLFAVLT
ncbi:MAG: hypothetical protein LUF34_07030, partial [Lachnospiraceae bacterium]|nr:hypothetical protein [Lachnospiraceae bacterium]